MPESAHDHHPQLLDAIRAALRQELTVELAITEDHGVRLTIDAAPIRHTTGRRALPEASLDAPLSTLDLHESSYQKLAEIYDTD